MVRDTLLWFGNWKNVRFSFIFHSANEQCDESERKSYKHTYKKPYNTWKEYESVKREQSCIENRNEREITLDLRSNKVMFAKLKNEVTDEGCSNTEHETENGKKCAKYKGN